MAVASLRLKSYHITITLGDISERLTFHVLPIDQYDLIIGKPWLDTRSPQIDWKENRLPIMTNETSEVVIINAADIKHTTVQDHLMLFCVQQENHDSDTSGRPTRFKSA